MSTHAATGMQRSASQRRASTSVKSKMEPKFASSGLYANGGAAVPFDGKDSTHTLRDIKASQEHALTAQATSIWDSEPIWIALYFFFNLGLTLYNKIALNVFPYPWSLTCIHSLFAAVGTMWCQQQRYFESTVVLGRQETLVLIAFSTLYTVNIAVSNVSLNLVSVPLHQVIRSLTPLFTLLISIFVFKKQFAFATYLSLVPVVLGVALATHGDYSCTALGFCLTMLSALLASIKGVTTNRILVGNLKFHPLELLLRMSPLSFAQCLVFAVVTGEAAKIYDAMFVTETLTSRDWTIVAFNGFVAFGMNVVSFTANKKAGALTMDVAANVKQVLTIVLAVLIFNLHINFVNFVGITLTIAGGCFYSYIEFQNKQKPKSGTVNGTTSAEKSTLTSGLPGQPTTPTDVPATGAHRRMSSRHQV